jgi:hypothetical protein
MGQPISWRSHSVVAMMGRSRAQQSNAATRSAERMARTEGNVGSVAFSRTGDSASGDFADAVVLRSFGDVPGDLSALSV